MMTKADPMTAMTARPQQGPSWNRRMVPFMAASMGFLFLSFLLVSFHAWFYTDAAVQAARIGALRSLLVADEPATPSPDLAGRVVHARGVAVAGQPVSDTGMGIAFEGTLAVQRVVERFRGGRKGSLTPDEMHHLASPGAHLGGWSLTEPLLAADPSALEPLRPGTDFRPPPGMRISESDPFGAYQTGRPETPASDPAASLTDGDRRLTYRALRAGPLSVIAAVDGTGRKLVPVRIDGNKVALLAGGTVDAATMIADSLKEANTTRLTVTLWAFAAGWVLFMIPALWTPIPRRIALTIVPLAGIAATLGAAMAAAVPGGIGGSFVAGQTGVILYVLALALLARRRNSLD
ncbi:TMEM43 family protein [Azospirillum agricola]|uniref:TMEM43 family protein n=1 Tax=Azospirillum agricola TaxID=1720247 RepID=UPI000A0F3E18|nr:TMEM43 family protein [Azospirillum agricola]SMH33129.1 Protein of unknown function [Azospirillum lipoferum]